MGMSTGGGEDEPMMDINTTPLIDILLVLLIMFIATNAPSMTQPVVINLEIDFDGTVLWNGTPVPDFDTLDAYFRRESQIEPQPELHIRPSKRVDYDVVARVLASAQRNRMLKIGFVGNEQFM